MIAYSDNEVEKSTDNKMNKRSHLNIRQNVVK